jgi:hypothetical protein
MNRTKINLQMFATSNQDLAARRYEKQFKEMLQAVFKAQAAFAPFFGNEIEALDGIQHKDTAFSVKTSNIPLVLKNAYNNSPSTAFGSGTGNSTRFGERTEIIYTDTDVPYTWHWSWHEGIDRHTVNNTLDAALADRLELQAQAKVRRFNERHGTFIYNYADKYENLATYTEAEILAMFDKMSSYYANLEVVNKVRVYVAPDLFNAIVNIPILSTAKNSAVSIDNNTIENFKGFTITRVPKQYFYRGDYAAYFTVDGIGKAFTGIETARTLESEDFDGIAFQGAGKAGEFGLDDNKRAVVAVYYSGV